MFYRKNVFAWEQIVRFIAGTAMIAAGLLYVGGWLGYVADGMGFYLFLTGIFGYCPACAMVGRRPIEKP